MNAESGPRRRADIEAKNPYAASQAPDSRLRLFEQDPFLGFVRFVIAVPLLAPAIGDAKARRCRVLLRLKASSGLSRGRIAEANVPRFAADFQASHPELSGVSTTWSTLRHACDK